MILMIDNYDSFTYNLIQYLSELGETVAVFRNDAITVSEIDTLAPEVIVLSPGPKSPKEAGICLDIVRHFKGKIPILGICLGHQTIAAAFGGEIVRAKEPVHGKVHAVEHASKGVFSELPSPLNVTRYHSLVVAPETLPASLEVTAWSASGEIMGLRHRTYAIEGVQFHPEAILSECGHELMANFLSAVRQQEGKSCI
ncbi:anthranilate synthase component II [Fusibacter sp. JL298sf-3]